MAAEGARKDSLEPPGVSPKPVIAVAVGTLIFLAVFLTLLSLFFHAAVKGSTAPHERPFPAPQLETSIAPRAVRIENPGPKIPEPTRQLDPRVRPARLNTGRIPLDQAMAIIAGRGAHAYDPVVSAPRAPAQGARP